MDSERQRLQAAVVAWRTLLGNNSVLDQKQAGLRYGASEMSISRRISGALLPGSTEHVAAAVKIALAHKVRLYPISTGNNWGYGSALPVQDDCMILDLAHMNRILDFDRDAGVVTLEPGVTQAQLAEFLENHDSNFMAPVTGAGPNCSLIGNVMERGYGITPYADHMLSFTSLEAVLPSGHIYRSVLSDLGAEEVDKSFKWGIGPYLDGLFTQGNFGIVTRMAIALAPQPERVVAFFFATQNKSDLGDLVLAVRNSLRTLGANLGSINLLNPQRALAMMEPYPDEYRHSEQAIPEEVISALGKRRQIMAWNGVGAIYGTKEIVKASKVVLRRILGPKVKRLIFVKPALMNRVRRVAAAIPKPLRKPVWGYVKTLDATLKIMSGKPNELALPLVYWKSGAVPPTGQAMNPARDGCGLIWYSPLVPMRPRKVETYVDMVTSICYAHEMDPLITLTSLSDRCFDSTVPLLFDPTSEQESDKAMRCFQELFETGVGHGFVPYRINIQGMREGLVYAETPYWRMVSEIKRAVDPDNILAPGRYNPR